MVLDPAEPRPPVLLGLVAEPEPRVAGLIGDDQAVNLGAIDVGAARRKFGELLDEGVRAGLGREARAAAPGVDVLAAFRPDNVDAPSRPISAASAIWRGA